MDSDMSENHVTTNAAMDYAIDPTLALVGASGDPRIQDSDVQHDQAMVVLNLQQQAQYLASENQWLRDELDISRQELASVCDELKQYRQQQSVSGIIRFEPSNMKANSCTYPLPTMATATPHVPYFLPNSNMPADEARQTPQEQSAQIQGTISADKARRIHREQPAQPQFAIPMGQLNQVAVSSALVVRTSGQMNQGLQHQVGSNAPNLPYNEPTTPYKIAGFLLPGSVPADSLDDFFLQSTTEAYDPLWWQAVGVDRSIFHTFSNTQKWSDFFAKVFAVGDRFVIVVTSNGQREQREAFVQSLRPGNLLVPSALPQTPDVEYRVSSSLLGLYEAVRKADPSLANSSAASLYMNVHVYRHGTCLGSLHQIRQGFALWQAEFELWAVKTGNYRLRHSRRMAGPHLIFSGGLWMARQPDGTFLTCPDQLAYH